MQADRVLATLAKLFNWFRQYDELYVSPVIPEMKRSGSHSARGPHAHPDRRRNQDDMGRVRQGGHVRRFVKVALLIGQRRAKVASHALGGP